MKPIAWTCLACLRCMHLWWQSAFEYKDKDNFGGDENSDGDGHADESGGEY